MYKDFDFNIIDLPRDTTQYQIAKAVTFRKSATKIHSSKKDTPYNNYGGNRQNIEKMMRMIYWADKGKKLIQVDQSGADALIVAYLCKSGKLRELFINGIKPHIYNALIIVPDKWRHKFKPAYIDAALAEPIGGLKHLSFWKDLSELIKSSDDWSSNERYYYFGKKVGHAFNYGMRGNRFRVVLLKESGGEVVLSKEEAESFINALGMTYPEVLYWHAKLYEEAITKHKLRNLFGWPLEITWHVSSHDMKDLYAWIPQSTVAGITTKATVLMQEYIEQHDKNWDLLAETHDSNLCQAPIDEVEECIAVQRGFMEQQLVAPDGTNFKMKSGVSVGLNWGPYKKDKNPDGLVEI